MEINRFEHQITGVVTMAATVEGRAGVLVAHSQSHDFGSRTDLPGFRVPATAEEAKNARFLVTWAQNQTAFPQIQTLPSYDWALRGGFDQPAQSPASVTLYMTNPANQNGQTIPSGMPALAFGKGTYTLASGAFIASASWAVGALVQVANTAEDTTDAGKFKYLASYGDRKVGTVVEYDSTNHKLTVELA
jgi:hypothetical protein